MRLIELRDQHIKRHGKCRTQACVVFVLAVMGLLYAHYFSWPNWVAVCISFVGLMIVTGLITEAMFDIWEADNHQTLYTNILNSVNDTKRLGRLMRTDKPYALFLRQFDNERSTPDIVHVSTPGPTGGSIPMRYHHASEVYESIIQPINSIVPVFELLNHQDHSWATAIGRIQYSDDWEAALQRYGSQAVLIVVYIESWSLGVEREMRWIKANSCEDHSMVIATREAQRILKGKDLSIENTLTIPPEEELATHRSSNVFVNAFVNRYGIDTSKIEGVALEVEALTYDIVRSRCPDPANVCAR